jgi:uncharacterized membrane protein
MDYLERYRYPIIGGIIGGIAAIAIFTIGFWKMVILIGFGVIAGLFLQKTGIIEHLKNRK